MDAGNEKQSRTVVDEYKDFASIRRACFLEHETACFTATKPKPVKTTSISEKEKQPVKTTGGKLASFLNSVFRNGNSKKMKKKNSSSSSTGGYGDARVERKAKVAKCFPANCYGWEMVRSCCNEIPQPGTLGYLDAAGASSNVLQLKRLRETLFAALIFQDLSFFDKEAVGDLTSRLGADCQRLSHVIENDIHLILRSSLWGIGALINLLTLSWPLAFSTLVICSILSTIFLFYGQFQKKAAKFTQEYSVSANEVQAMAGQVSFAVLLGGVSVLTGHVSAEQLMKYVLYCEWLIDAAWRLEDNLSSLLQAIGASEKVFQLMVLMPSDQFLSKVAVWQRLAGKIEFVNVSVYYPSRSMGTVLEHVNISVQTNEMVAIVGLSGSGKSTLVNLLLRLYEPTSGEIFVDGFPLRKLHIRWLRDKIGFVGQHGLRNKPMLMNLSHLFPMVMRPSLTMVCSVGGQKQRIAIARAIVRDPAILILDEATGALDAENEYYIARLLHAFRNEFRVKRTVIVIAHRLSTIKAADKIMVMVSGRVVELGNHVDLLCKGGLYARFVRTKTDDLA
ncbi:hypothetical protein ACSBR1_010826 [Camellia fascicularis]